MLLPREILLWGIYQGEKKIIPPRKFRLDLFFLSMGQEEQNPPILCLNSHFHLEAVFRSFMVYLSRKHPSCQVHPYHSDLPFDLLHILLSPCIANLARHLTAAILTAQETPSLTVPSDAR